MNLMSRLCFWTSVFRISVVLSGVVVSAPALAEDRLKLTVDPTAAVSPTDVRIKARVAPNAENRVLEIVAESPEFFRSSEQQLNGASAPRVTSIVFHHLPAGDYFVTATLKASNKTIAVVKRVLSVVGDRSQALVR
jgi:hypothetical protein